MPIGVLAFAVGGAFLGSLVGVASLGWAIGSLIGQFLFTDGTDTTVSGPRLENTAPAVSNIIGNPIQIPYGSVRVPGSVIWSNTITEVVKKDKQKSGGGSGGGSSTTTVTYEYYLDFAVAICEGPIIGIRKIWANNKLIYDVEGDVTQEDWLDFNLYKGTDDQLPDPYMRNIQILNNDISSADNSPAYRGLSYIVFKQFDLRNYGNRAPTTIDFEVIGKGVNAGVGEVVWDLDESEGLGEPSNSLVPGGGIIGGENGKYLVYGTYNIRKYFGVRVNLASVKADQFLYHSDVATLSYSQCENDNEEKHFIIGVDSNGYIITIAKISTESDCDGDTYIRKYSLSGKLIESYYAERWVFGSFFSYKPNKVFALGSYLIQSAKETTIHRYKYVLIDNNKNNSLLASKWFFLEQSNSNTAFENQVTDYEIGPGRVNGTEKPGPAIITTNKSELDNPIYTDYHCWFTNKDDAINDPRESWLVYKYDTFGVDNIYTGNWKKVYLESWFYLEKSDYPAENTNPACGDLTKYYNAIDYFPAIVDFILDTGSGVWGFVLVNPTGSAGTAFYRLASYYVPNGNTKPSEWYQTNFDVGDALASNHNSSMGYYDVDSNTWVALLAANKVITFNFTTKTFNNYTLNPTSYISPDNAYITKIGYNKYLAAGYNADYISNNNNAVLSSIIDLDKPTPDSLSLGFVVDDIANRAGISDSLLDVTDINSVTLDGFSIRDREPARKSIEDVIYPFFVDPVVSDWILKFVHREANNTINTVEYIDLGCSEDLEETAYSITYPDENSLPKEVDFRYLSKLNNYQTAHQRAARYADSTNSIDKKTINTYVVISDDIAKKAATRFLRSSWLNSARISIKLPKKYGYLEPTDLITFTTAKGTQLFARIVEIFNTYNILEVNLEVEDVLLYDNLDYTDLAAKFDTSSVQKIPVIAVMVFLALDSYPIYDILNPSTREDTESYIYLAGGSYFPNWQGGTVFYSNNNVNFTAGPGIVENSIFGVLDNASSNIKQLDNYNILDKESSFVVDFGIDPQLSTLSKEEALTATQNILYIENSNGGEFIVAQTVSNNDTRYTFTDILRERYNSNTDTYSRGSNNKVVVIDPNKIVEGFLPYGIYDVTYYFKAVSNGINANLVESESQYYSAKWNSTIPPNNLTATVVSSDIVFTWHPISKYNTKTLVEDKNGYVNKVYKLEILDSSNSVVRTISDLTSNTYTYLSADITSDNFTLTDTITYRVYNKSYMKSYDVPYSESKFINPSATIDDRISSAVSSSVSLVYDFKNYDTINDKIIDEIGTKTGDLTLTSGNSPDEFTVSIIDNNKVIPYIKSGMVFKSSGITIADGSSFTIVIIVGKSLLFQNNIVFNPMIRRDNVGGNGSHKYGIQADTNKNLNINGDLGTYSTNEPFYQPTMISIVTTGSQTETIYRNDELIATDSASTFISNWFDELEFGDVSSSWTANKKIPIEYLLYWETALTSSDIQNLYNLYKIGGFI